MKKKIYIAALNPLPFLPYISGLLQSYAEQDASIKDNYSFQPPFFYKTPVEQIAQQVTDPAVLGLSCYVWNFKKHLKLAALVKRRYPNCLVVLGGPHLARNDDNFFRDHPYIDLLVHGEGEISFYQVLCENLKPNPEWSNVKGISYSDEGAVMHTAEGDRLPKQFKFPSPYLTGMLNDSIGSCTEAQIASYALLETNRGCPYSCTFCDWGAATMSKLRLFDLEQLKKEIELFGEKKIPNLFICDANFGILERDIELAEHIAATKIKYGFPQQVRVNFAKNSNEHVFRISKLFSDVDMLMGTTLSMQSVDMDVLKAIKRDNIKLDNYFALQKRYAQENIHTYTELILGLPLETESSFKKGISQILEMGNHHDLRIYELNLLPNAPMNTPANKALYRFQTIWKKLDSLSGDRKDEAEYVELVVANSSMTNKEWVDSMLFAKIVQALHNGCYTRYLSLFLRREIEMDYKLFYESLIAYFSANPSSVLGHVIARTISLYQSYLSDPELPLATLVESQPDMSEDLLPYGIRKGWTTEQWMWLYISSRFERFYSELAGFIATLPISQTVVLQEVMAFQQDMILHPGYDPAQGKAAIYKFDLYSYFFNGHPMEQQEIKIVYSDTHTGINHKYPLKKDSLPAFAKAAVGPSYPISRIRHYAHHQLQYSTQNKMVLQ
jgi:putative methyltransferase